MIWSRLGGRPNALMLVGAGALTVAVIAFGTALGIRAGMETPTSAAAGSYQDARSSYMDTTIAFDSARQRLLGTLEQELQSIGELRSALAEASSGTGAVAAPLEIALAQVEAALLAIVDEVPPATDYAPPTLATDAALDDVASAVDEVLLERVRIGEDRRGLDQLRQRFRESREPLPAVLETFAAALPAAAQSIAAAAPEPVAQSWRDDLVTAASTARAGFVSTTIAAARLRDYADALAAFLAETERAVAEAPAPEAPVPEVPTPEVPTEDLTGEE